MNKLGIIVSSTVSLTDKIKTASFIKPLILSTNFSNREIKSGEVTLAEYFDYVEETKEVPKTSQPATGEIIVLLNEMLAEFESVIVITPSINLSGTNQNVHLAITMLDEEVQNRVKVIDSHGVGMTETILCEKAIESLENGLDFEQIYNELDVLSKRFVTYGIPGSLTFLKRSGRVNFSQLIIGKLINLKIIVKVENNEVNIASKGRGYRSVLNKIESELTNYKPKLAYYTSIREEEKLTTAVMELFNKYNVKTIMTDEADIVSGTHFGPNSFGFTLIKE